MFDIYQFTDSNGINYFYRFGTNPHGLTQFYACDLEQKQWCLIPFRSIQEDVDGSTTYWFEDPSSNFIQLSSFKDKNILTLNNMMPLRLIPYTRLSQHLLNIEENERGRLYLKTLKKQNTNLSCLNLSMEVLGICIGIVGAIVVLAALILMNTMSAGTFGVLMTLGCCGVAAGVGFFAAGRSRNSRIELSEDNNLVIN